MYMCKAPRILLQLPRDTAAAIERLGVVLVVARLRYKGSLRTCAARMGMSVPKLQRPEAGEPSVCIGIVATALRIIQRDGDLVHLAAPEHDQCAIDVHVREAVERARAQASAQVRTTATASAKSIQRQSSICATARV